MHVYQTYLIVLIMALIYLKDKDKGLEVTDEDAIFNNL
jgi:hypothetical protein